jgi:hypothetical protein
MKNTTHATEAEAEATYRVMRAAFVNSPTIAEFRANLVKQVELEDGDPRGVRRMIAVVEYDEDVFVLGGLTFTGSLTLYRVLENALKASMQQAEMLASTSAGEA